MTVYVIDASVAIKWIFKEEFSERALRYYDKRITKIAPDFMVTECLGAIQSKVNQCLVSREVGWEVFNILQKNPYIDWRPVQLLYQRAYQLANAIRHPVYDCLYLALAERVGAPVVTADRKFFDRAHASFTPSLIAWVEDAPVFSA